MHRRAYWSTATLASRNSLAGALNNQSVRLTEVGRREDALAAVEEAVTWYRGLAADRPDAFTPDLAGALTNLGLRLTELGRFDDAMRADREAVLLYRDLQQRRPGLYNEPFQNAVHSLAIDLRDLGHTEDTTRTMLRDLLGDDTWVQVAEAGNQPDPTAQTLQRWEPVLDAAAAVARGSADQETTESLNTLFADLATSDDWAALIPVLPRIMNGEHSPQLLKGLDPTDTAIATALIDRLHQSTG